MRVGVIACSRPTVPFVYLDEFQNFTTLSVATMLSELRKYHVGLTLAHQFLGQVSQEIRDAILGNAGTMISFRVGPQVVHEEIRVRARSLSRELDAKPLTPALKQKLDSLTAIIYPPRGRDAA